MTTAMLDQILSSPEAATETWRQFTQIREKVAALQPGGPDDRRLANVCESWFLEDNGC